MPCGAIRPIDAPIIIKISNPIERAMRKVNALIILSESRSFLTNANKAIPRLKRMKKKIDMTAILKNIVIYSPKH